MTDIRVVLDTNVIISAVFWRGSPYKVMRKVLRGELTLVTSTAILEEVMDRLQNKFNLPAEEAEKLRDILLTHSLLIEPTTKLKAVKADEKDNKIVECAVDGRVDLIVTGDSHILNLEEYRGIKIVTPAGLLKILE